MARINQGDALAVIPTSRGTRLRCVFQHMQRRGHARGLVPDFDLYPASSDGERDRFRLLAVATLLARAVYQVQPNKHPSYPPQDPNVWDDMTVIEVRDAYARSGQVESGRGLRMNDAKYHKWPSVNSCSPLGNTLARQHRTVSM
jgi:hypothetical protein